MPENQPNQNNHVSGGNVGGIFNGGNNGTIVVNPGPPEDPIQLFKARVVMNLPTQGVFATTAALITVVTFFTGWRSLAPIIEMFNGLRHGRLLPEPPSNSHTFWLFGFIACVLGLVAALCSLRHVRAQTFQPPRLSIFPTVAGITDYRSRQRLALVRFSGECLRCGGKLRFYDKPTAWHDEVVNGRRKRIVDQREPAAECKNNPRHWYRLEVTDSIS